MRAFFLVGVFMLILGNFGYGSNFADKFLVISPIASPSRFLDPYSSQDQTLVPYSKLFAFQDDIHNLQVKNPDPVCEPGSVSLDGSLIQDGNIPSTLVYAFYYDELCQNQIPSEECNAITQSGTYFLKVTDTSGQEPYDYHIYPIAVSFWAKPNLVISDPTCDPSSQLADLTSLSVTAGSDQNLTFSYYYDDTCNQSISEPQKVNAGTYYIQAVNEFGCISVSPVNVLTNEVELSLTSPTSVEQCTQAVFDYEPTSSVSDTDFQWFRAGVLGIQNPPASGTGNPKEILVNLTGSPKTVTYTFQLTANGKTIYQDVSVLVKPHAILLSSTNPQAICSYSNFNYTPIPSISSAQISWERDSQSGIANAPASGTGKISERLVNLTTTSQMVSYRITLTVDGCSNTQMVNVLVKPSPTVNTISDQMACKGEQIPATILTGPVSNTTFSWSNSNPSIGLMANATGATEVPSFTAANSNLSQSNNAVITIRPVANGCVGLPLSYRISVNPLPDASISGTTSVCQSAVEPIITFKGINSTAPYTFVYRINGGPDLSIESDGNGIASLPVPTTQTGTYTYTLVHVVGSTGCQKKVSGSATVTVNALPEATISGSTTICQNSVAPQVTFVGSKGLEPYSFDYSINGGGVQTVSSSSGSSSVSLSAQTAVGGKYDYRLLRVISATGCSTTTDEVASINVSETPTAVISGSTAVCQGEVSPLVTFTAQGGTAPYTFSYRLNNGPIQNIVSVSDNSVSLAVSTQTVGRFTYSLVQITSGEGCSQMQAGNAVVTVNPRPTATITAPQSAGCLNGPSPYIEFAGSGGTAPYTFTYAVNGGSPQSVTTTSGSSVIVPVSTSASGEYTYQLLSVKDSGTSTCSQNQGGTAKVIITNLPTATISGSTITCLNSSSPKITFNGSDALPPYTFTYKINGGPLQTVTTTSGNSVSVDAPTDVSGTFVYALVNVTGANGCPRSQSGSATIVVAPTPTASIQGNSTVCQNTKPDKITFTGMGGTAPYTFVYSINGGSPQTISTTAGNSASIVPATDQPGTFIYTLQSVTDLNGCNNNLAGIGVTVVVNPQPTALISGTTTVCQNSPSPKISFVGSGGNSPYTFTYRINGGTPLTIKTVSGNRVDLDVPTTVGGTFTYELISVTNNLSCSNNQSGTAVVTVIPQATLSSALTPSGICTNTLFDYSPSSTTSDVTFSWVRSAVAGVSNPSVSGNGSISETLINTTSKPITVLYHYTLTSMGCTSSQDVSLVVSPQPQLTSSTAPPAICSQQAITYVPTSNLPNTQFQWSRAAVAGIANPAASGTGTPNEVLKNTTTGNVQVTYLFTLSSNGCTNPTPFPVVFTILPAPSVSASISNNQLICPGTPFDLVSTFASPAAKTFVDESFNGFAVASTTSQNGWTILNNSTGLNAPKASWTTCSGTTNGVRSSDNSVFYMATGQGNGTISNTSLSLPPFSTKGYESVTLSIQHYLQYTNGDVARIEASIDGVSFSTIKSYTGTAGSKTNFASETNINLNAYKNQNNVYVRFFFNPKRDNLWAIDNVKISGVPPSPNILWTSNPATFTSTLANPTNVSVDTTTTFTISYTDNSQYTCPGIDTVSVHVRPTPDVTIQANFCTGTGKVRLTASPASSYLWSTGETTQSIEVDLAGFYEVTITDSYGCTASANIVVNNNLVKNGDFSQGNTLFTSGYKYVADGSGQSELNPEGYYGVGPNANSYHTNFFGKDHTTNSGSGNSNFMVVNGWGSDLVVWEQTVTVNPNTDYYFSAWAMNLNGVGNEAKLRFEVNGVQVGTIADLGAIGVPRPTNNSQVNMNNWVRFYSQPLWNSGSATSARIRIVNLQPALSGNDFGLDDISFGTLNATPFKIAPTDNNACEGGDLILTANVTGGAGNLSYSWSGPNGFTSNQANPVISNVNTSHSGTYTLTVTDAFGCPYSASKTVTVNPIPHVINPYPISVCSGTPFTVNPPGVPSATTFTWLAPTGTGFSGGNAQNVGQPNITQTLVNLTNSPVVAYYEVTPSNGSCVGQIFKLQVTIQPTTSVLAGVDQSICAGSSISLDATMNGAVTGVTWSAPGGTFSNPNSLSGTYTPAINTGSVILTLTTQKPNDACPAAISTFSVNVNQAPVISFEKQDIACYGAATGKIALTVSGGIAPYSFFWSTGETTKDLNGLTAGTYSVIVKDQIGCTASQSITISEPTLPLTISLSQIENVLCSNTAGSATVMASNGTPGYTYQWNTNPVQSTAKAVFTTSGNYVVTVTDQNGCSASANVVARIEVNTPPVITNCPPPLTLVGCDVGSIPGLPYSTQSKPITVTDFVNAGGQVNDNCGIVSATYIDSPSGSCPLTVTRTYSFADAEGLSVECEQLFTIVDNTPPTWITAAGSLDRTLDFNDAAGLMAAQSLSPTATDNCDKDLTNLVKTSGLFVQGHCPQKGTYTNTWIVTDRCGNKSTSFTQVITVQDVQKPFWTTSSNALDRALSCDDLLGLELAQSLVPVAFDNSNKPVNLIKTSGSFVPAPSCLRSGNYTNSWIAIDECGNVSDPYIQNISVSDNTPPVWSTVQGSLDVTLECDDDHALQEAQSQNPVATDNCGGVIYKKSSGEFVSAGCGKAGTYTNTWSVADECGNSGNSFIQVISVVDHTAPVVVCPPTAVVNCGDSTDPSKTGMAEVNDNCDAQPSLSYADQIEPGNCSGNYTILRTWKATDQCGNEGICKQIIVVQDVTPPQLSKDPLPTMQRCVKMIEQANVDPSSSDINPDRPDFYLLTDDDKQSLRIEPSGMTDNCSDPLQLILHWKINFYGNKKPPIQGIGQIALYPDPIRFDGAPSVAVSHSIEWWLEDTCGNKSAPKVTRVIIMPRPDILKH